MGIPKHYYLMIDTETCGTLENPLVYDFGIAVIDRKGNIYQRFSLVIKEVFYDMYDKMQTAYYKEKLPQYYDDIANGKKVVSFWTAKKIVQLLFEKWNITAVIAHNARFDYNALNNTCTVLNNSEQKCYFFPLGTPIWCTFTMAQQIYKKRPTYKKYCEDNNYICKNGQVRLTAEILYRFITNTDDFQEKHTALEDVQIEVEIFKHIMRQHKKIRKTYYIEK
ncbi:MAG: hypothetical protein ACI4PF_04780 [Christensenellales bacterium]